MWVWKSDPQIKNMNSYLYTPLILEGLVAIFLSSNIFQLYKKCMGIS